MRSTSACITILFYIPIFLLKLSHVKTDGQTLFDYSDVLYNTISIIRSYKYPLVKHNFIVSFWYSQWYGIHILKSERIWWNLNCVIWKVGYVSSWVQIGKIFAEIWNFTRIHWAVPRPWSTPIHFQSCHIIFIAKFINSGVFL